MSLELVKELIKELENSSLSVLECEFGGAKVKLQRGVIGEMSPYAMQNVHSKSLKSESEISEDGSVKVLSGKIITSPMVGTFYTSPAPDKDPYVSAGQNIKKGDIVCIIEAMKLMNEIEAEEDGVVTEILVKNGDMVEYGEPLFVMK